MNSIRTCTLQLIQLGRLNQDGGALVRNKTDNAKFWFDYLKERDHLKARGVSWEEYIKMDLKRKGLWVYVLNSTSLIWWAFVDTAVNCGLNKY
jgi:hypothetical protein